MVNHQQDVPSREPGLHSMTGFATSSGADVGHDWVWEIRSVNGKALDLRLRLPDWIEGLEPAARAIVARRVARGSVTLSLKIARQPGTATLRINPDALKSVLQALRVVRDEARAAGLETAPIDPASIMSMRGVAEEASEDIDTAPLRKALLADLDPLLDDFLRARAEEGARLQDAIALRLDQIEALIAEARIAVENRREAQARSLGDNLARVMAGAAEADPGRVAQELALMVVKSDVSEELDRLQAHVAAARALLSEGAPVGRKFDFLMQEFMREANTLCSKAGHAELTRIGLDLKTVIDQMREQVQNVE